MRMILATALLVVLALPAPAAADPADAQAILQGMKTALEPKRPSTRTIVVATRGADGSTIEWTARQARKHLPDGNRILTVLLEPEDVRGVGLLIREHQDSPDEMWMYVPTIRRVRKLVAVGSYESFLGTDFTLADLGFVDLRAGDVRFLGEKTILGVPLYNVEQVLPTPHQYYSRVVSWIAKNTMLPARRDYFDSTDELWKTILYQKVAVFDGIPTVVLIHLDDKIQGTSTELRVGDVLYDATIPDQLFDEKNLANASTHPLWGEAGR